MSLFLETLKDRIIVFDGAMGTNLQVQNLTLDDFGGLRFEGCNENLLVTRPDAVEKVHAGFSKLVVTLSRQTHSTARPSTLPSTTSRIKPTT
jgi:methionine synthase I (cobalamin-dependent)